MRGSDLRAAALAANTQIGAYNNVARPGRAASRRLRAQVQLMFPK